MQRRLKRNQMITGTVYGLPTTERLCGELPAFELKCDLKIMTFAASGTLFAQ